MRVPTRSIASFAHKSIVRETPKEDEPKPEEPQKAAGQTVVSRALSEIQITDISGALSVLRKGAKTKERPTGVVRLNEGDVLSADKSASFRVAGLHPMVISDNTSLSIAYVGIENPKGELGNYLVSDGTAKPVRWRIRPPSFINLSSLSKMAEGHLLSDLIAINASVDIVMGEVDR